MLPSRRSSEDFVQQGVDAIALAPCDPAGLVPAIEAAVDAGIPVVVFDNQAETDKVSTSVNFDYEEDGGMVGDWTANYINEKLDGKAKVAAHRFSAVPIVCGGRVNGFVNKSKELPGVEIVSQQDGKASRSDSMNVMENILTSNPDVQIVFGVNFDTCAGRKSGYRSGRTRRYHRGWLCVRRREFKRLRMTTRYSRHFQQARAAAGKRHGSSGCKNTERRIR